MTNENHAFEQAQAQMSSIREMVAALGLDWERLEELRDQREAARLILWNMPGYMPESAPVICSDADEARETLAGEMEQHADTLSDGDAAVMVRTAAGMLRSSNAGDDEAFSVTVGGLAWEIRPADGLADEDDNAELTALEKIASDSECEDEDEDGARQRIEGHALSVGMRSGWYTLGGEPEPEEFRIVLCTGGPHVEMRGTLRAGSPDSASLYYQDWGTPLTERDNAPGDEDALLAYAGCFYFGE